MQILVHRGDIVLAARYFGARRSSSFSESYDPILIHLVSSAPLQYIKTGFTFLLSLCAMWPNSRVVAQSVSVFK